MSALLEICVDRLASIDAAITGGADRLELCSALELGGLTPSNALTKQAVERGLPVHVMIRPRGGDFAYSAEEVLLMRRDIAYAVEIGAKGVVFGVLNRDHTLNIDALARLREAAGDLSVVLHRAIDLTPDPLAAVDQAKGLGFDRILSSGSALTAPQGTEVLRQMVLQAGPHLSIIAGSGVQPDNVARLIAETGVSEVHASASEAALPANARLVELGFTSGPARQTHPACVKALRAAIEGENPRR